MARLTRDSFTPWLAAGWLGLLAAVALLAPYLPLPYAPATLDLAQPGISPRAGAATGHWLGTDALGRDVLANLLFAARTMLLVVLPAALLAFLLGAGLGGLAGFWSGRLRLPRAGLLLLAGLGWWALALPLAGAGLVLGGIAVVWGLRSGLAYRRLATWPVPLDAFILAAGATLGAIPRLLLVVAITAGDRLSLVGLLALLALTSWPAPARMVRAETLRLRVLPFVEAAQSLGLPAGRIFYRHVLPQALHPLRTAFPLSVAGLMGLESTLSFLGIGLPPETASWGRMLSAARLDPSAWWTAAAPVAVLFLTTAALRVLSRKPGYAQAR